VTTARDIIATASYYAWHGTSSVPWEDQAPDVRAEYLRAADSVEVALRDAGLLPPDNAEARIEWGVRSVQHGTAAQHVLRYDSEAKADDMLDYRRHRAPAGCTDPHATKVRRTITTWGDGGMHITPWQTVEETP